MSQPENISKALKSFSDFITHPVTTVFIYIITIAFFLKSGYNFIQSMEHISTLEHWRFTYSMIGFLIAKTFLLALIFTSIFRMILKSDKNNPEKV